MNPFKKSALALRVAAGMLLSLASQANAAPASSVVVTNTAANPVPTVAQGTTTVAGSVSIAGTTNVNVANTPTVNVANLPSTQAVSVNNFPSTQNVQVSNSAAAPVPVADVARQARIPYMSSVYHNDCAAGHNACFFQFATPPAGTRLVAENLSGYFMIDPGAAEPVTGYIETGAPSFQLFAAFIAPLGGHDVGNLQLAAFNQPTRFYVDAGQAVFSFVTSTWVTGGPGTVVLSGYLENCAVTGCPPVVR